MKKEIIEDIKNHLIVEVVKHYGYEQLEDLGGYQNAVFSVKKDNKEYIIRVTERAHRQYEEIEGEITFVNFLFQQGVNTYYAIDLKKFKTQSNTYYVTIFNKAIGLPWQEYHQSSKTFYEAGKTLGKIHSLSKQFPTKLKRNHFLDNQYLKQYRVIENQAIKKKLKSFLDQLKKISVNDQDFGLIHGDYQFGNIIYNPKDQLTIIDFDECEYHFYIYDLAVYLFYYLLGGDPKQIDIEQNKRLFKDFMRGYLQETTIRIEMIQLLPQFLRLREYKLLISLYRRSEDQKMTKWAKHFIDRSTERILNDLPFIDIDYEALFKEI